MGLGQNGVVLAFFEPKRRRFGSAIFFFLNSAYTKTTSFWTALVQNGVVLNQLSHTQNDVIWVSDSLFKTTPFWLLISLNDAVLLCIKKKIKMKRRRFTNPQCPNRGTCSSFQFGGGGGGGGGAGVTGDLDRQASGGPADSGRRFCEATLRPA